MPAKAKKHKLSDGQLVDYHDVMKKTGLGKGAANVRLKSSEHSEVVFAKKGNLSKAYKAFKYKKRKEKAKPKSNKRNILEEFIVTNRPFYVDIFYKMALQVISCSNTKKKP